MSGEKKRRMTPSSCAGAPEPAAGEPAPHRRRPRPPPFLAASAPEGLQKSLKGTFSRGIPGRGSERPGPAGPPVPSHPDGWHVENGLFQFRRHMSDEDVCKKRLYTAMTDPTVKFMLEKFEVRVVRCLKIFSAASRLQISTVGLCRQC